MRQRLIELLQTVPTDPEGNRNVGVIADYLLENGVVAPPCKIGDTIYNNTITTAQKFEVTGFSYGICALENDNDEDEFKTLDNEIMIYADDNIGCKLRFPTSCIGKTVFLSREEAKKALKGSDDSDR